MDFHLHNFSFLDDCGLVFPASSSHSHKPFGSFFRCADSGLLLPWLHYGDFLSFLKISSSSFSTRAAKVEGRFGHWGWLVEAKALCWWGKLEMHSQSDSAQTPRHTTLSLLETSRQPRLQTGQIPGMLDSHKSISYSAWEHYKNGKNLPGPSGI